MNSMENDYEDALELLEGLCKDDKEVNSLYFRLLEVTFDKLSDRRKLLLDYSVALIKHVRETVKDTPTDE